MMKYVEDVLLKQVEKILDCSLGCSINCAYCCMAKCADKIGIHDWQKMDNIPDIEFTKYNGLLQFPHRHDITEQNKDLYLQYLLKAINLGNKILITTKPRHSVIDEILKIASPENVIFRMTITSIDDDILKTFEPGGTGFQERLDCLKKAYNAGYETFVNIEPFLDDSPIHVLKEILPFVTGKIAIGTIINNASLNISKTYTVEQLQQIVDECNSLTDKVIFRHSIVDKINNTKPCGCRESKAEFIHGKFEQKIKERRIIKTK